MEEKTAPPREEIMALLRKRSDYALNSLDRELVMEAYGMAKMALHLRAITYEKFREINERLITNGINNPEWIRKARTSL